MRLISFFLFISVTLNAFSQESRDTVLKRCPLYITDTVSSNNFFIEFQPTTLKVYRVKGDLTIVIQQKDQFFTLFFKGKKLKNKKYKIEVSGSGRRDVEAKYSFRSGSEQVSYVDVSSGTIETQFDKEKNLWNIKVNGLLKNMVERSVTYYKVKLDLNIP